MALEIVMPRLSDSMEEGTILKWLVQPGDHVDEGRPLVALETDKASVVYEAQAAGTILALRASEGDCVRVGTPIAVIGEPSEGLTDTGSAEPVDVGEVERAAGGVGSAAQVATAARGAAGVTTRPTDREPAAAPSRRPKASPLARRIAAERGVDLSTVTGSGPQGRVIRADVDRAAADADRPAARGDRAAADADRAADVERTPADAATVNGAGVKGARTMHELTRLQQTVARRMAESRATVPDIELRSEVDAGELVAMRERLREVAAAIPSLNDFIIRAAALALREFPRVNGAYRDGGVETFARVNVGIAVAAEGALVVPTIFDADTKSVAEIGEAARGLAARVREGSITPAELSGGTFTVSNLGMYGIDSFSAVINSPQAAILAVGAMRRRPVVDEESGAIAARPTIQLTLACDHRILYGVDGARFLTRVRELLERPLSLLL
jgi:pyruvate dehydrogenase E2 component (dihydrolipoamide acetyltransferase)